MVKKKGLLGFTALLLLVSLILGIIAVGGCTTQQTQTQTLEDISVQEASTLIQENQNSPDFVIIDVRTPAEFSEGHIEGAVNIDFRADTFENDINALDKDKKYLIYCRSGNRSSSALDVMGNLGFEEVYNMLGGINAWNGAGLPTVS